MKNVTMDTFTPGGWDEDRSALVYLDGEEVGEVCRVVEDIGATSKQWVVEGYAVMLWSHDDAPVFFQVRRLRRTMRGVHETGDYPTARAALTAARAYARRVLSRAALALVAALTLSACATSGPRPQDVNACWDFYAERVSLDALRALCSWDGAYPPAEGVDHE